MAELLEKKIERYLENFGELEAELFEALTIHRENINEDLYSHASKYTEWAVMASIAETLYRRQKRHVLEQLWPQCCRTAKLDLEDRGESSTKAAVESLAIQSELYIRGMDYQSKLGHVLDILKKIEWGFTHRKSMIELLANRTSREAGAAPKSKSDIQLEQEAWADSQLKKTPKTVEEMEEIARSRFKKT